MDKKLEVKDLQISFRTQGGILKAVRNISFDLYKGETLAIVGESGSGKSVTSKAIMGILAGNSIVEGGEIVYDGQDLLKISEEDFHKIRGDKIAMIFQDPMSSLNPIMKIGQQLTEAMILKAKTGKKNAKREFNNLLKLLVDKVKDATISSEIEEKAKIFDAFCIESIKIEDIYNEAYGSVVELEVELKNLLLLLNKKVKFDIVGQLKGVLKNLQEAIHPYVLTSDEETNKYIAKLTELISQKEELNSSEIIALLTSLYDLVDATLAKDKPNFFTLGYYKLTNPNIDLNSMDINEMNKMTRAYLDENFMLSFIDLCEKGVQNSHYKSLTIKKEILPLIDEVLAYFKEGNITEKESYNIVKPLIEKAESAIDRLSVKKNSTEYVFHSAIKSSIAEYFNGVKRNPIEEKIYQKAAIKYQKLVDTGKTPDWVLKPQIIVDLELKLGNICKVLENLKASYNKDLSENDNFDAQTKVIEIIDFLKEQASKVVVKMNKKIAKAKAIKLMEEVGIPEPTIRFNQYPFEFSGGMRQRIVIAIALSANPDILICDEPTTALDVTIQAQILELINKIKKDRNLSVIFITHNLGVVANMADRIGVMYAGKIVEYGTSEDVFYSPAHPYTWALLSSMPDLNTTERLESIPGTPPNMIYPPKGDAFAARNKYALEIDFELEPPLFEISETHFAASWLLHPNAPKVEMPKIIQERIARMTKGRE